MDRVHGPRDVEERARWLAELSVAIDQAQRLAWTLGVAEGDNAEAKALYGRLEAIRAEVDALRRGRFAGSSPDIDPIWTKLLPWPQPLVGPAD